MVFVFENDCFVWIDCEMMGFDFVVDEFVEIVVVIIDFELCLFDVGFQVVI